MKKIYAVLSLMLLVSCSEDDKAIDFVNENIERGAVLRTIAIENSTFDVNTIASTFLLTLEEQDIEEGGLLESVTVAVRFIDNTPENGLLTTENASLDTVLAEEWNFAGILPRNTLSYSYEELLNATGLSISDVLGKDQFVLDLSLNLKDGRTFNESNASSIILGFDTFFSSPFTYTITLVNPVPNDLFTGLYTPESILEGPIGATFVDELRRTLGEEDLIEITAGTDLNVREFRAFHRLHHIGLEQPRRWTFTVTDNTVIMGKHQLSSPEGFCIVNAAPILLGPDQENGPANTDDDSVFELWFVEGYLGFDGECGFTTAPSRYRFSKQ